MAKGGISKKRTTGPSQHSRAARRATSPGIDTDKSLKNVKPPEQSLNQRPAVLAAHHSGGVTKKARRGRKAVASSKARQRHEKAMDKAEAIVERTAKKVEKSKVSARGIQHRRKTWDDINKGALALLENGNGHDGAMEAEEDDGDDDFEDVDDLDEEMEPIDQQNSAVGAVAEPSSIPLPAATGDDEEIL